ncbi:MAG: hypothetical protein KKB20_17740 [Proteobacteria bacterium]|nr:hypothetical protein [Pseudomonadota bacterium]
MTTPRLVVDAGKCTECMSCQLICSYTYSGAFNPEAARVVIRPPEIRFTDDCVPGCVLCARYCVYGAIVRPEAA